MEIFTIGYSNHTIAVFRSLLRQHGITAIADVRSRPFSRYLTHFNQIELKQYLKEEEIHYVFLGKELGARPEDPFCYVEGRAVYEKIAQTDNFKEGIDRVRRGVKKHRIALMCMERDPLTCHRAILVAPHLKEYDLSIFHIKGNGGLESHEELEDRLLQKHGFTQFNSVSQLSLFDSSSPELTKADCLLEAYKLQGQEIAYTEKKEVLQEYDYV